MSDDGMIDPAARPSGVGCAECEATGSWWLHLRRCAKCGHIGCCDDSLNRHGTAHFHETGHAVEQSFEPGEDWFWDFERADYVDGPRLADPQCHPPTQSTPGPAERVPADWMAELERRAAAR
jgi:Zn-finger in ubiquitin-hydrolases and other protein